MNSSNHRGRLALLALALACLSTPAARTQQPVAAAAATTTDIPQDQLVQAEALKDLLSAAGPGRPIILQVGSHVLFAEAHIPGSEYIGATGQPAGLEALRERAKSLRKDQPIVLYCGCCPWGRCPNIRPAYQQLQALGFTHLKVLYLAQNFGADWVDKGYLVARGR